METRKRFSNIWFEIVLSGFFAILMTVLPSLHPIGINANRFFSVGFFIVLASFMIVVGIQSIIAHFSKRIAIIYGIVFSIFIVLSFLLLSLIYFLSNDATPLLVKLSIGVGTVASTLPLYLYVKHFREL